MAKSDIGILFDVSGSMQSPFNSLSYNSSIKKADEILNVIDRICIRGNRLKNEQVRVFSILFGGRNEKFYDFCNLIEIANNKFRHTLSSDHHSKASKYGYRRRFKEILSDHGRNNLYLDNFLYCESCQTERLCEMGCYLLEDDHELRRDIYEKLPNNCKDLFIDKGIGADSFFGFKKEEIKTATTDVINEIYRDYLNTHVSKIIREDSNYRRSNGNKLRFIDGNVLINIKNNLQGKICYPDKTDFNIIDLFKIYMVIHLFILL